MSKEKDTKEVDNDKNDINKNDTEKAKDKRVFRLSKKAKYGLSIFILIIVVYAIYIAIKTDSVNKLPENQGELVDMDKIVYKGYGSAATADSGLDIYAYYDFIIVDNLEDVDSTVSKLRFNAIEYRSYHYSFIDVMLSRYNDLKCADVVYTYYNVGSSGIHDGVVEINRNKLFFTGLNRLKSEIAGPEKFMSLLDDNPDCFILKNLTVVAFNGDHLNSEVNIDNVVLCSSVGDIVIGRIDYPNDVVLSGHKTIREISAGYRMWYYTYNKRTDLLFDSTFISNNDLDGKLVYLDNDNSYCATELVLAIKVSDLSKDSQLFQENKEFLENERIMDGYVIFMIPFDFNAEYVVKILNGKDYEVSYDGVVVSAKDSIDGEEHPISSFDEYIEYTGLSDKFYR